MNRSLDAGLVWLRRDLRVDDHAALYHALRQCRRVYVGFVFDRDILDALPSRRDRRVEFIRDSLVEVDRLLRGAGGALVATHARARDEIPRLAAALEVDAVYVAHDYEPGAIARDEAVARALERDGRGLRTFKDQAIFDRDEVMTGAGRPYTMFTPYRKAWDRTLDGFYLKAYPVERHLDALAMPPHALAAIPSLESMGFERTDLSELGVGAGPSGALRLLDAFGPRIGAYRTARERPGVSGGSMLSVHLRFGTVSVRRVARAARAVPSPGAPAGATGGKDTPDTGGGASGHGKGSDSDGNHGGDGARTWLSEICWRDFFFQMLYHLPHIVDRPCRPAFDAVRFDDAPELLAAWKAGRTGYPLVDAGMRQLAATGFMHNRARMVTASFLVKQLGIDWRSGERFFADCLNDYDLSANVGNWQWVASTGCDAQPWFRIFNPVTQSERFDRAGAYIRRWVPELARLPERAIHAPWRADAGVLAAAGVQLGVNYPEPVVDLDQARKRSLARYAAVQRSRPAEAGSAGLP